MINATTTQRVSNAKSTKLRCDDLHDYYQNYFKFISKTLSRLTLHNHPPMDARVVKNVSILSYAEIYNFDIENLIDLVEADR